MSSKRILGPAASIVLAAASCVGTDDSTLDIGAFDHPRYARLRERLSITLEAPADGGLAAECSADIDAGSSTGCCNSTFCSARGLAVYFATACVYESSPVTNAADAPDRAAGTCGNRIIDVERDVCVAQRLLQIVESPDASGIPARAPMSEFGFTELVIGPQDPESNSEIALEAIRRLSMAQGSVGGMNGPSRS